MHGARITLTIMFLVTIVVRPIGHLFGTVAGDFGGRVDTALMHGTDIFLSFPSLIPSLAFVAALGPSLNNAIIAISLTAGRRSRVWRGVSLALQHTDPSEKRARMPIAFAPFRIVEPVRALRDPW